MDGRALAGLQSVHPAVTWIVPDSLKSIASSANVRLSIVILDDPSVSGTAHAVNNGVDSREVQYLPRWVGTLPTLNENSDMERGLSSD